MIWCALIWLWYDYDKNDLICYNIGFYDLRFDKMYYDNVIRWKLNTRMAGKWKGCYFLKTVEGMIWYAHVLLNEAEQPPTAESCFRRPNPVTSGAPRASQHWTAGWAWDVWQVSWPKCEKVCKTFPVEHEPGWCGTTRHQWIELQPNKFTTLPPFQYCQETLRTNMDGFSAVPFGNEWWWHAVRNAWA